MEGKYCCPNCGSENTSSVPLVYKYGHYTGTTVKREVIGTSIEKEKTIYADGHTETKEIGRSPIYGNVKHTVLSESDLASEVAPPQKPEEPTLKHLNYDFVGAGCASGCLSIILVFILCYFMSILWDYFGYVFIFIWISFNLWNFNTTRECNRKNEKEYEEEMEIYKKELNEYYERLEEWNHLYLCYRCGCKFHID